LLARLPHGKSDSAPYPRAEGGRAVSGARFVPREQLSGYEWDSQRRDWKRPIVDREVLKSLSVRSTCNGILRIAYFLTLLAVAAVAAAYARRINICLALATLYVYYFFYGFWVALAHEFQHKTAFAERADWLSEIIFCFVQTLIWNSPTYARISHKLHHRYTMVRGIDPETDWPEVITTKWLSRFLLALILKILVVGAVGDLLRAVKTQVERVAGRKDRMMREHCSENDVAAIRAESLGILLFHAVVAAASIGFRIWELLAFVTIAWQIGSGMEVLWHATEHIGRPYNVNDYRLNTRSIHVSWFIKLIFWGLDDHVDHHLFPIVPSRNLPKLHRILEEDLPNPDNIFGCWAEMFRISRVKDSDPTREFVSVEIGKAAAGTPEAKAADTL
jgi:fatty acid desaturase